MFRSPGDDLPSVRFGGHAITIQDVRDTTEEAISILRMCNDLVLLHGPYHPLLIDYYTDVCKEILCGRSLSEIDRALAPFREAAELAGKR